MFPNMLLAFTWNALPHAYLTDAEGWEWQNRQFVVSGRWSMVFVRWEGSLVFFTVLKPLKA
jgi:hypothetical protein